MHMQAAIHFKPTKQKVAQKERLLFVAGHANAMAHFAQLDLQPLAQHSQSEVVGYNLVWWIGSPWRNHCVCLFCAHQSCFNIRSQTLNKEYNNMTKYNQTIKTVSSALPSRLPAGTPQWMFPTDTIEMSLLWMYLIYFNMGLLNEIMILKKGRLLTAVSYVWSGASENIRTSFPFKVLCSHFMCWSMMILHRRTLGLMRKHSVSRKSFSVTFAPASVQVRFTKLCTHLFRFNLMSDDVYGMWESVTQLYTNNYIMYRERPPQISQDMQLHTTKSEVHFLLKMQKSQKYGLTLILMLRKNVKINLRCDLIDPIWKISVDLLLIFTKMTIN